MNLQWPLTKIVSASRAFSVLFLRVFGDVVVSLFNFVLWVAGRPAHIITILDLNCSSVTSLLSLAPVTLSTLLETKEKGTAPLLPIVVASDTKEAPRQSFAFPIRESSRQSS
jgi:hypothetical protein